MNNCTRVSDSSPTGSLIRKHQCQEYESVSHPPSTGPAAGAVTTVMPYNANASARFSGGKVSAKIDCSVGASPPPPTPCNARANSIVVREVDIAHSTLLPVNSATQII